MGAIDARQLVCPAAKSVPARGGSSYVYIAGQTTDDDPENVLMYEPLGNHEGPGGNVLFADTHAEFLKEPGYTNAIARTRARLATRPATRPAPPPTREVE
jgi:prepilin-type processing-associated H-X9-DG protein